ncbi:unnamed protein product [Trichogramma brassicae]|uniref:Uncharacterized protein n=1 Tax=Trichogramma brassicae TaxID=86971 RepID=A0A6H5IVV4_9HYME|nr:unnamed protein product [Trichogramma brassicae]
MTRYTMNSSAPTPHHAAYYPIYWGNLSRARQGIDEKVVDYGLRISRQLRAASDNIRENFEPNLVPGALESATISALATLPRAAVASSQPRGAAILRAFCRARHLHPNCSFPVQTHRRRRHHRASRSFERAFPPLQVSECR